MNCFFIHVGSHNGSNLNPETIEFIKVFNGITSRHGSYHAFGQHQLQILATENGSVRWCQRQAVNSFGAVNRRPMKEWKAVRQSHEPSQEVVIHGCDYNLTDSELFSALRKESANIANATICRDKDTGLPKGIGFATFSSLEDAKTFIEKTSGLLRLRETVLRLEYRKNTSWICDVCGHLNYKKTEKGCRKCYVPELDYVNDGTGDIGSVPSYLLLVRGLDPQTKEETIFTSLKKKSCGLIHIRLVKRKETGTSMGFCFVMFSDVDMASKFVRDAYETPISINGKYLSVTYSHPYSFVPVFGSSEWVSYAYLDTNYKLVEIAYWDELYYAKEYPRSMPIDPSLIKGRWTPPETLKSQDDLVSDLNLVTESQATLVRDPVIYGEIKDDSALKFLDEESSPASKLKKKIKLIDPKDKTSIQIMKWKERQEELACADEEGPVDLSDEALKKKLASEEEFNQLYEDLTLIACLLCERQFKVVETLKKHQLKSELHRANMDELIQKKIIELREQLKNQAYQEKPSQYRDRAFEIRKLHGSSGNKITFSIDKNFSKTNIKPLVSTSKPISEENIGNKMLKKMGWKSGEGLGANKDGITEPLSVCILE